MLAKPILALLFLGTSGLGALRLGWRRPEPTARTAVAAGWVLLAASIYIAVRYWGLEFGISYALAANSILALLLLAFNLEFRPVKSNRANPSPTATTIWHKSLTFLSAGPIAGIVSCQFTLLAVQLMPGSEINRMAAAAILFPILWGISAYLSCLLGKPGRQFIVLSLAAAAASAILYLPEA